MPTFLNITGSSSPDWMVFLLPFVLAILIIKGSQKIYNKVKNRYAKFNMDDFETGSLMDNTFIEKDRLN